MSALRTNLLKSYLQFILWQVKLSSLVQTSPPVNKEFPISQRGNEQKLYRNETQYEK